MKAGIEHAWNSLESFDSIEVCQRCGTEYDDSRQAYSLTFYGQPITISMKDRSITGATEESEILLNRLAYFSKLSILTWLATAKAIPLANRLIKPADMKSGDIYYKGSHILPLSGIAGKYGANGADRFLQQGARFGGTPSPSTHGDASILFTPFYNFQMELILWTADDEFPARSDLLFDAACESQAPADIIWSLAMMTILLML